jgi:hypothetical protein
MSKTPKPMSEADLIAAARKRLQEMGPGAMKTLEELAQQTKNKRVARKSKRLLGKHKGTE